MAVPTDLVANVLDARQQAQARAREAGHRRCIAACSRRSRTRTSTWRIRSSAVTRRTGSRCAARSPWRTTSTKRSASSGRGRRRRDADDPAGHVGPRPGLRRAPAYDPAAAKALLDKFGYIDRDSDGWRELPDGKPLTIAMASPPTARDRQGDELWQRSLTRSACASSSSSRSGRTCSRWAARGSCRRGVSATSTHAEGDAFLAALRQHAGIPNSRASICPNTTRSTEARAMPDGPERTRLCRMSELVAAYAPWMLLAYRIENMSCSRGSSATRTT